ncbi:hypothetical protein CYMTET_16827 [Cymbomonas tetramitiformis]|uniref:Uncharacterized protein n=1 Tax=Cymbomonas tetramitiformis TaxID=36881 RepID=A0AAE0GBM9_9CHLO|nr:hypothetical protein CYMTET_16827 [Cymbomonas tetramitiformis]
MPVGADHTAAPEGSLQPWADNFTCAQKPTPDVLAEHGMLKHLPSGGYAISKHMCDINYRDMDVRDADVPEGQVLYQSALAVHTRGVHRDEAAGLWRPCLHGWLLFDFTERSSHIWSN